MSLVRQLGLEPPHGALLVSARGRWHEWQDTFPVLGVCEDLLELPGWVREADPAKANEVLLALAELGAVDGGNDPAAAAALVWLLIPGAVGIARALMPLSERVDELVAAQLWICARTVSWAKGVRVAATILMNARRGVMTDLGLSADARASRTEVPSADLALGVGRFASATPVGTSHPPDVWATDDAFLLRCLLEEAVTGGVVSRDDVRLLLHLAQAADTSRAGRGRGGLLARTTSTDVAQERGVSRASVARQADRALRALRQSYARDVRAA